MKTSVLVFILALSLGSRASAEQIAVTKGLAAGPVTRGGRSLLHRDPLEAQIVKGEWHAPAVGDSIGSAKWTEVTADKDGWLKGRALNGGYVYAAVPSDRDRIMILEAAGHSMVYVNGVPRTGDPYSYGYLRVPVALMRGANDFLFSVGRGQLHARLVDPTSPATLDASDSTLPDLRIGEKTRTWGAVVAINATNKPLTGAAIEARLEDGRTIRTPLPTIVPLGVRKVAFRLEGAAPSAPEDREVELRLVGVSSVPAPLKFKLRVRKPEQTYKRTFISQIDGSVQYYAVNPCSERAPSRSPGHRPNDPTTQQPALVLTLHGASVEAIGQADAYAPKTWADIVAPTNRRPYGFDWEEWGRLDALEVLGLAQKELGTDPHRTYLTGHSMGGHGTWQIGVQYPDRFAAIAPSAGWISFFSYGGGQWVSNPDPVEAIVERSKNPSDTLALAGNYAPEGVYILHGDADDNVPISEARTMAAKLKTFHHDWDFHEQPGAGHWWSVGDEPGAQCVDWPAIFDLFARRRLPDPREVRAVHFSTANPEVSSRCYWATIEQQIHPLQISKVDLRYDPIQRRFSGTTDNVANLSLDRSFAGLAKIKVEVDGSKLETEGGRVDEPITLVREGSRWEFPLPRPIWNSAKSPARSGTFKAAFNHNFLFVYSTKGTPDENAWSLAKARYDAETFGYRGNGSVDVQADTEFDLKKSRDRSVILYGNAETNAAWPLLLGDSPVQVRRGSAKIGDRELKGDDLACLFVRPRMDSETASIGVVSGTGLAGMRLCDRVPVFLSGVGIPDCVVLNPASLTDGAKGLLAAGFFGNDWSIGSDFAWR